MRKRIWIILVVTTICCGIVYLLLTKDDVRRRNSVFFDVSEEIDEEKGGPFRNPRGSFDDNIEEQNNQDNSNGVVSIADLDLPLSFEDDNVSVELQRAIEVDLEEAYSTMTSHRRDEVVVDGERQERITFQGGPSEVPDLLWKEFGVVVRNTGKEFFRVTKVLSRAYDKALAFRRDHGDEFDLLIRMVDRIKDKRPDAVELSDDINIGIITVPDTQSDEIREHIINLLVKSEFRGPSLLDLGMEAYGGEQVLSAKLYVAEASDVSMGIYFIYLDGEWNAVLGRPGT